MSLLTSSPTMDTPGLHTGSNRLRALKLICRSPGPEALLPLSSWLFSRGGSDSNRGGGGCGGVLGRGWLCFAPPLFLTPQPPHHQERLANNMPGHFGPALKPIGEDNRHFDHFHPFAPEAMRHFDLKTVTVRRDLIQI